MVARVQFLASTTLFLESFNGVPVCRLCGPCSVGLLLIRELGPLDCEMEWGGRHGLKPALCRGSRSRAGRGLGVLGRVLVRRARLILRAGSG
ncbi:unnamed protein product [Linum trigynum]|uniref:Secreted protein n=1 Tax=Linum trigynum TaxID=586398 RepID=A0AAV2CCV7_9ROSI